MYHTQSYIYTVYSSNTRNKLDGKTYIKQKCKPRCKIVIIYSTKLTWLRCLKSSQMRENY